MENKKKKDTKNLSRRDFIKVTGGAAALAGVGATGLVLSPRQASASELPKKWDEELDVVVIGSGFAGLAAATEARNAGASVIVLEKMMVPGGNSIINGGLIAAAGSPLQEKKGVKDSPERMFNDMLKAGRGLCHPELTRLVAEKSNEIVQWTIDYLGVEYRDKLNWLGGHSVGRSYRTTNSSGSGIVKKQLEKLKELGVELRKRTLLTRIIRDADGRVKGVEIRQGYKFPNPETGTVKYVKAKKAVVLATGGFGRDIYFRTVQDPRLKEDTDSTNQPGATAEGMLSALDIGATPVQISWIQLGPWACADTKGYGYADKFGNPCVFQRGIMVDPATGTRFVNELADRKVRADAMLANGHPAIGITDAEAASHYPLSLDLILKPGYLKKFDTLDDLASAFKMPAAELKATVERFNSSVAKGQDDEFGKPITKKAKPLVKTPFYAIRMWPKVHHCMGGIQINTDAKAIGLDRKPIKGLYVAGEVTGGVHGAVRLGSNAIIDCLVFGRIAGKNAAAEKSWS